MKIFQKPLCVQELIRNTAEMIRFITDAKNVQLDLVLPENDLYINADREKIVQVISNIADNATKFVPEDTGKVVVHVEDRAEQLCISVEDNGPGIHGDDKKKVFDRFVQVEKHIGPGKHGTGLGLAICRDLIQLHSGRIWIEDNPGGGAIFRILLPKCDPQKQNASTTESAERTIPV